MEKLKEIFLQKYITPPEFDNIIMNSDGEFLTGLCFEGSPNTCKLAPAAHEKRLDIFDKTRNWLDMYFGGIEPDFTPEYKISNLTPFRKQVIDIMCKIPYGETVTYNDIAKEIAERNKIRKMSAQAVGGAIGRNPICIIVPCHRVVGSNGSLVGYGGGIKNKVSLLRLEGQDMNQFTLPKKIM